MKISNALLDEGWIYPFVRDTLDMYKRGEPLTHSPLAEWGRRTIAKGGWWYGTGGVNHRWKPEETEVAVQKRLRELIELYESIKRDGYNGSELVLSFYNDAKTGLQNPVVYDGYHRLCILKYLSIVTDVNYRIRTDFPLLDMLRTLNGGEYLYQPTGDSRTDKWVLWRPDCGKRLMQIAENLLRGSVLDCGCETGFFTRELAKLGYEATGVEANSRRVSIARYLAATQNAPCKFVCDSWQSRVSASSGYTNVIMLAVLHHDIIKNGLQQAFDSLGLLRGKCSRLIIEFPLRSSEVAWYKGKLSWSYTVSQLCEILEEKTLLRTVKIADGYSGNRPLIVLGAK